MTLGLFIISALISLSIGTSCGTIAAIVPIAVSISQTFGINPSFVLGATVGGAMFGDNMSLISDTKIAASRTQNVNMRDEMLSNLRIITIPAILCIILYMLPIFAGNSLATTTQTLTFDNYIKVCPYILLLVLGISGLNVMFLLFFGTILNVIIGLVHHSFGILDVFGYIGDGTVSMATTIIVAMLAGGLLLLVRYNGGITYIIKETGRWMNSKKSCEIGICFLVGLINLFTANNTVAIITSGSIVKELSEEHNVDSIRAASLLDTTSCVVQGLIPYGAQILIATSLAATLGVSSFTILKGMFYPALMLLGLAISVSRTR
jgi:Na+/H+ antiporter NhaC